MAISTYSVTWRLDVKNILDNLADFAGLTPTDGVFIVGDGANWVAESGATARASLGAQAQGDVLDDLNDLGAPTADGEFLVAAGAGAFAYETGDTALASLGGGATGIAIFKDTTAAAVRTEIGAQQQDAALDDIAGLTLATGDIFFVNGSGNIVKLAIGSEGQVVTSVSGVPAYADASSNDWSYATPQATTSGTAIDFTGIPSGVSEIEITFEGISLSGSDQALIQIGDAGGFETTGYSSGSFYSGSNISSTAGFIILFSNASAAQSGLLRLIRYNSSGVDWSSSHGMHHGTVDAIAGGGVKTLSAELTQVRLTRTGTNTFDAGQISLRYR